MFTPSSHRNKTLVWPRAARLGCLILVTAFLPTLAAQELTTGDFNQSVYDPDRPPPAQLETLSADFCDAPDDRTGLSRAEIDTIAKAGVRALDSEAFSVAVTDRAGNILAVWQKPGSTFENSERAVALARTGAFFSNDQAPLSSRTIRFISQKNFPPGIDFLPNGALYGIENTNRGCNFNVTFNRGKCVPRATSLRELQVRNGVEAGLPDGAPRSLLRCDGESQDGCGMGAYTGKYSGRFENGRLLDISDKEKSDSFPDQVHGGGIPIFKDCRLVGGIGVFGVPPDHAEFAALVASMAPRGASVFGPVSCLSPPFAVFLEGIRLPFVKNTRQPTGTRSGNPDGGYLPLDRDSGENIFIRPAKAAADGWLVGGPEVPRGSDLLGPDEVERIVLQSIATAEQTRAAIRLPLGSRTRMAIAVSDLDGNLLALYRMPDATVFSIDVAVAKSRNVIYFSSARRLEREEEKERDLVQVPPLTAVTNRTINFGSQPLYPPGISGSSEGPFFDLFIHDLANPCSQGFDDRNPLNINGVVFFPGSVPLYKNGQLVGGLGISGDGVEQDDVVSAGGATGFEAPGEIRADRVFVRRARLPYLKFNRNPSR